MKYPTTLTLLFWLLACISNIKAQMPIENCYGYDATLYNGALYSFYMPPSTEGFQFYQSPNFVLSNVTIRGNEYKALELNYDVYNQQVIYRFRSASGGVNKFVLSNAWLQSFTLGNNNFIVLSNADSTTTIYRVIGNQPLKILYHYNKELAISSNVSARNMRFTPLMRESFLQRNNTLYRFRNNRSFVGLLKKEDQPDVRKYLRQNNINLRKADDAKVAGLLDYLNKVYAPPVRVIDELSPEAGEKVQADQSVVSKVTLLTLSDIPDYNPKKTTRDTLTTRTDVTEAEQRYLTGRKTRSAPVLTIGTKGGKITAAKARIQGEIHDAESGEPLFNATIFIDETKSGAITDINGILSLFLKPGKYNAIIEILGYEKLKVVLNVLSDGYFKVSLNKAIIDIKEFVVYGDRQMNIRSKDPGIEKITMKAVKELPMMMGERDIIKISGMLPGIVSAGEGSAGLNVRGGSFDQNAFYINKVPVYNTSHLFGFFPAFNADIIKDFSIYKGHIPASFGGRLSSVFNVVTRQGNRKRYTARGGLSPITGNIIVEGPVINDKASVLLSARSSYSDWILERIKDPQIRASTANFSDFSGSVGVDLDKTNISVFAYHSVDKFKLAEISNYSYSNDGASLIVAQSFSQALRGEISLVAAEYNFSTTEKQQEVSAYEHAYKLGHYEVKAQFQHLLSDVHNLEYGAGMTLYKLDRGTVQPFGLGSLLMPVELGREKGAESFVYLSDAWEVNSWLNLSTGIRYAAYIPLGPQNVYTYFNGSAVDLRNVNDTIQFANNRFIKWYHQPDLRVAVNIETDESGTVKLAFNRTHQNLFMLNSNITISPNTQWKLADYHLKPSESNQYSAGIFRTIKTIALDASVEGFYKQSKNYPEFKDGANFLDTPQTETTTIQGNQNSYGLEFMLRRNNKKLDGWLSYTWSKSLIKIDGPNEWERINDGIEYPSNFDIPHAVNLVANYHMSRRITFSGVVVYQTGRPITYPVSMYYINGVPYLDYSSRNAYRVPDYFRTDLSMTIEGNLRKNKLLHSSLSISVYNLTGRDNPASVYFLNEKGRIKSYKYSVIGVPILTATWMFKLGNYASE